MKRRPHTPPNDCAHLVRSEEDTDVMPTNGQPAYTEPHYWCVWAETIQTDHMPIWASKFLEAAYTLEPQKHCPNCPAYRSLGSAQLPT